MNLESYQLISGDSLFSLSFISEGRKGSFKKVIQFQEIDTNFYNLAFGDEDLQTNEINDLIVTNNGDTEKVLATVARAVYLFTDELPQSWIYIEGSTLSRTRLYQIGINKFLTSLTESFEIFGQSGSQWIAYNPQNRYSALIARRKKKYF